MPNSEQLAQEFMDAGRPTQEALDTGAMRQGDKSFQLFVKTPQFGQGFAEWAINGYNLDGEAAGKIGDYDYSPETGKTADVKVNIPTPVRQA